MKVKVNIWQVGFMNMVDSMLQDGDKAVCKERGYVLVENKEDWEEETWNLLNWSCWTHNKPDEVHSPLEYCNSDIILQIDGTNQYKRAESVGWTDYNSLEDAINALKKTPRSLWPLKEAPKVYSSYKSNGKTVWGTNDGENWTIIN